MKLSNNDKEILTKQAWGEPEIEKLDEIDITTYSCNGSEKKKILEKTARDVLGNEVYLSGVARAAFSGMAYRTVPGKRKKRTVQFVKRN